jgi:peptidoglycan/xylan/chitin deacetylase (PgdA/CDA1 family)
VYRVAPWPGRHAWAAALTHDLDIVSGWPAFTGLRIAELLSAGEVRQAGAAVSAALAAVGRDPVGQGVARLLESERAAGLPTTWFVIPGRPTLRTWMAGDVTYRVDRGPARRLVRAIAAAAHEIAVHGSFATVDGPDWSFADEARRLAAVSGTPVRGVRQHFLRFRPGETQRAMVAAGFAYDASYGFSDRNGFRLGVADVVPAWDDASGRELALDEVPLVWMDRAQSKYGGIHDPERWVDDGLDLARACRAAGGLWVGLWHPNLTTPLGYPGAETARGRLLAELLAERPYVERLGTMVTWRRARRSVRAVRVSPDGRPELAAAVAWDGPLTLERGNGAATDVSWPTPRG